MNANDQSKLSYHPKDKGDHSKYCIRIEEGSMEVIVEDWIICSMEGDGWSVVELRDGGSGI